MVATTAVVHSPWLLRYVPRIHTSAARLSFHRGTIGRRLSIVEFAVSGSHRQVAPESGVVPRYSSWWRRPSALLTSGEPLVGSASVEMYTTSGSLGSSEARPV